PVVFSEHSRMQSSHMGRSLVSFSDVAGARRRSAAWLHGDLRSRAAGNETNLGVDVLVHPVDPGADRRDGGDRDERDEPGEQRVLDQILPRLLANETSKYSLHSRPPLRRENCVDSPGLARAWRYDDRALAEAASDLPRPYAPSRRAAFLARIQRLATIELHRNSPRRANTIQSAGELFSFLSRLDQTNVNALSCQSQNSCSSCAANRR